MSKIVIIGAGAMGSAFALPCLDNSHDINIVGTHLENDFIDQLKKQNNLHPGLKTYIPQEIKIFKFRSMTIDAEKNGAQWSSKEDMRITRIGKIMRKLRLDELPQLFCVINGTMSLIGPRPERPEIENQLLKGIPYYKCRQLLKPGISGWAQVNYPYGASVSDTEQKLSFDIYYITHCSFLLDMLILFKTIRLVLNARGSKPSERKYQ